MSIPQDTFGPGTRHRFPDNTILEMGGYLPNDRSVRVIYRYSDDGTKLLNGPDLMPESKIREVVRG